MKKTGEKIFSSDHPLKKATELMSVSLKAESLQVEVRAKPGAKHDEVILKDKLICIATHARPIDGEANAAITKILAKFLGIAPSLCLMIRGEKSKNKVFIIPLEEKSKNDPARIGQLLLQLAQDK